MRHHVRARAAVLAFALVAAASPAFAADALIYDKTDAELAKIAAKAAGSHAAGSVSDAAAAAHGAATIATLMLAGHGESGVTAMGSGDASGYQKGKSLTYDKLSDVSTSLQTIAGSLGKGSYVILSSCYTGSAPHGATLVQNLSKIFMNDVIVVANTACVGVGISGKKVCTLEGNTTWQTSHMVAAENGKAKAVDRTISKEVVARSCFPEG